VKEHVEAEQSEDEREETDPNPGRDGHGAIFSSLVLGNTRK
jgi:hypothetical protein